MGEDAINFEAGMRIRIAGRDPGRKLRLKALAVRLLWGYDAARVVLGSSPARVVDVDRESGTITCV